MSINPSDIISKATFFGGLQLYYNKTYKDNSGKFFCKNCNNLISSASLRTPSSIEQCNLLHKIGCKTIENSETMVLPYFHGDIIYCFGPNVYLEYEPLDIYQTYKVAKEHFMKENKEKS